MEGTPPPSPPSSSSSSSSSCPPPALGVWGSLGGSLGGSLYHEKQHLELCALHALNNLLQSPHFTRGGARSICKRLAPGSFLNPHQSFLGTGNYDINLIMAALESLDLGTIWWDKRRSLQRLVLGKILGFILNVPSVVSLGFLELPWRRKHWLAIRQLQGTYYNLDSKLQAPEPIGGEAELRVFLQDSLSQDPCQLFLVVSRDVEKEGTWLSPE